MTTTYDPAARPNVAPFPAVPYRTAASYTTAYLNELSHAASTVDPVSLDRACELLVDAYSHGRFVFSCGNGGSAAVANHLQCDHLKGVRTGTDLHPRVISLSSSIELLTAIANDLGYHDSFAYQLRAQSHPGDVLIVISSSGNSPNILHALEWAAQNGLRTIALTGFDGGKARAIGRGLRSRRQRELWDRRGPPPVGHARHGPVHPALAHERGCRGVDSLLMTTRAATPPSPGAALSGPSGPIDDHSRLRVAINLLTEDPRHPSGAHWFWTRMIPEMARRRLPGEELQLMLSPKARCVHPDYGEGVRVITFPWSNERRVLRTASEHLYAPLRLPARHIDVLNTGFAPLVNPGWSLVIHVKTMHAFTAPDALGVGARMYRRLNYQRSVRIAEAIIINSNSLKSEIDQYLEVDPRKVHLIYEAVDHDTFTPGNQESARAHVASFGIQRPFVLFVSSLWRYKNCDGLLRAWGRVRDELAGRQLVIVGAERDQRYAAELRSLAAEMGVSDDVVFVGGVPLEETVNFYRAADLLVYPSLNETFGLPILEAMACACPVVTSNVSAMPEIAGGAAVLADPHDPASLGHAIVQALGAGNGLRTRGLSRAREFTWGATAEATLNVYREAAERRRRRRGR